MKISIIALGLTGNTMYQSFKLKNIQNIAVYDKYKNGGIGNLKDCLETDIMFIALPTLYNKEIKQYNKTSICETCDYLSENNYKGVIVIKSTIEPETINNLSDKYLNLQFVHNPEFLTARTAFEDFHNQKHIVLGKGKTCSDNNFELVKTFYKTYYSDAKISECTSLESESMKIFCNSFYAVKVQFFTELYLLCQKNDCNFDTVKNMMLCNNWINPMHTSIPGPDGQISYGGDCFPKDTEALNSYMEKMGSPNSVLNGTILERNELRKK